MENTLIYGKSGCGKTFGYMFNKCREIIDTNGNLVVVDRKGEYFKAFGNKLKNKNYNIMVINLNNPEKSNGFNILKLPYQLYLNNEKDLSLRMLNSIYKEILFSKDFHGDSFWINSSANYLIGLTLILFKNGKEEEINLGSVYTLMMEYEKRGFDKLKNYLESLSVTDSLYSYLSGTVLAPVDTRGGIMATIKERICLYIGSENILKLLCTDDIKLNSLNMPYALFILDNEDYASITNAIIDEFGLYVKDYNLIIDNIDDLNKIIRLDSILNNYMINRTNTYIISKSKEFIEIEYNKNILDKFNNIINSNDREYPPMKYDTYKELPTLRAEKIDYLNPTTINFN